MTFRPRDGVGEIWVGRASHWHVGRIMGIEIMLRKDRSRPEKAERLVLERRWKAREERRRMMGWLLSSAAEGW